MCKKPKWSVETHDAAKVHGEVHTRYIVAVAISVLHPSFIHLIPMRDSSLDFDNDRATYKMAPRKYHLSNILLVYLC